MKSKCVELIKAMLDYGACMTASHLASVLSVSERSVKSYIAEINGEEDKLITSSRKGYIIDLARAKAVIENSRGKLPQTSKERVGYIITRLITNDKSIDLYDLERLQAIIRQECEKYHYYINEYVMMTLVLDIVIGMERIKKELTFDRAGKPVRSFGIREQELAQNIAAGIRTEFHVSYSDCELDELTIILISHLMKMDYTALNSENIGEVVGRECMEIVDNVLELLKKTDLIDVHNKDFVYPRG